MNELEALRQLGERMKRDHLSTDQRELVRVQKLAVELRECLARLVGVLGEGTLQIQYPNLLRRINAALEKAEAA